MNWLLMHVLYAMGDGQEEFDKYFHIEGDQVVLNDDVDVAKMNAGLTLVLELVSSSDNYVYYAGTAGDSVAALFQGTMKGNGKLNDTGKDVANKFTCGGGFTSGCGTLVGTLGRPGVLQPAALANGDPVFAVIAYNERAVQTQIGLGDAGEKASAGLKQRIPPVRLFIHESAENLAFRSQGNWDYPRAHGKAIEREFEVGRALSLSGGFAGGYVETTVPKK